MTSELKPCPFCGAKAKVKPSGIGCYAVYCDNRHRGVATSSKETAAAEWNTRARPSADPLAGLVRYSVPLRYDKIMPDGEYVLHSEAAKIIAAKVHEVENFRGSLVASNNVIDGLLAEITQIKAQGGED